MSGKKERPAGSLKSGEPAFLAVGKIRRPHGVQGALVVELYTDFPERLQPSKTVYLGENHLPLVIRTVRQHNEGLLLQFVNYRTPEEIGLFRNQPLYVKSTDSPQLPEGEYYFHELLDLEVRDDNDRVLGIINEIIETGANDVYVVSTPSGGEMLLPAIPDVIKVVDLKAQRMIVHLIPGLEAEEEPRQ